MKKTNKKGFTIVELVIVIAIIAILSAILVPVFGNIVEDANETAARAEFRNAYTQAYAEFTNDYVNGKASIYVKDTEENTETLKVYTVDNYTFIPAFTGTETKSLTGYLKYQWTEVNGSTFTVDPYATKVTTWATELGMEATASTYAFGKFSKVNSSAVFNQLDLTTGE